MDYLSNLSEEEINLMQDAIPMVTILIAGADDNIDEEEKAWGEKLTHIRTYNDANSEDIQHFYQEVQKSYSEKVTSMVAAFPKNVKERTQEIADKLSGLNEILPKIDPTFAGEYYTTLVSFARQIAEASGGFMRFFSVSNEEKKLMDLPMITPIEYVKETEESDNGSEEAE